LLTVCCIKEGFAAFPGSNASSNKPALCFLFVFAGNDNYTNSKPHMQVLVLLQHLAEYLVGRRQKVIGPCGAQDAVVRITYGGDGKNLRMVCGLGMGKGQGGCSSPNAEFCWLCDARLRDRFTPFALIILPPDTTIR
jgi:hypothetical protein